MKIAKKVIYMILIAVISLFIYSTSVNAATSLKVTADTLNLRKEASTNSSVLTLLSKGDTCELIEKDGEWYKVKYKTYTGYVSKDYVKELENSDNEAKPEENNTEGTTTEYTEVTGKISKKSDVKILPLINSSVIDSLNKNENVTIISELNGWAYVQTNSVAGWIREDVITDKKTETNNTQTSNNKADDNKTSNNEEDNNKVSNDNKNTSNTNNDDNKTDSDDTTSYTEKTMYVNESYVNLRKQPSTSSSVIMVVELNTKLTVIGERGDWYKVNTSSGEAYVSKKLLSNNKVTTSRSGGVRETDTKTTNNEQTTETIEKVSTVTTTSKTEETTSTAKTENTTSNSSKGEEIVAYAKKFLGVPYVYGGASTSGFDCSGFTMYVYKKFGISMKHGAQAQAKLGTAINADKSSASSLKKNLQPGDLVFFLDYETMDEIGHCGIYIGNGNFIHASSGSGYCVKINSLLPGEYYNTRYCAARRII